LIVELESVDRLISHDSDCIASWTHFPYPNMKSECKIPQPRFQSQFLVTVRASGCPSSLVERCLGSRAQNIPIPTNKPTIIGCITCTPVFEAIAPVMKGNAADPACPRLAVKPIGVKSAQGLKVGRRNQMTYLRRRCEVPVG
jgi:hypothetical protein